MPADAAKSIQTQALRSAKWAYLGRYLPTLTTVAAQVFLARLLLPSDYGIVGICTSVVSFSLIFQGGRGVGLAVIQAEKASDRDYDCALTMNMLFGAILYLGLLIASPAVAAYARDSRVTPVIAAQGLSIVLSSYSSVLIARQQRIFMFRHIALRMLPQALAPILIGVPLAFYGFGYWSLVVMQLAGETVSLILLSIMVGWVPRPRWDVVRFTHLFRFSRWFVAEDIVAWSINNVDTFLITRFISLTDVGVYVFAKRIVAIGVGGFISPLSPIMYAAFCRFAGDRKQILLSFQRVNVVVAVVCLPLTVGLASLAPVLIPWVFGSTWAVAGIIVSLQAVSELSYLATPSLQLYGAMGKPWLNVIVLLVGAICTICGFILAIPHGLVWFVGARVAGLLCVLTTISFIITIRLLRIPAAMFIGGLRGPLLATGCMAALVCPAVVRLQDSGLSELFRLFALGAVVVLGACTYLITLRLLDPETYRVTLSAGRGMLAPNTLTDNGRPSL